MKKVTIFLAFGFVVFLKSNGAFGETNNAGSIILYPGQSQSIGSTTVVCANGRASAPEIEYWYTCECHNYSNGIRLDEPGYTYRGYISFYSKNSELYKNAHQFCRQKSGLKESDWNWKHWKAESCRIER